MASLLLMPLGRGSMHWDIHKKLAVFILTLCGSLAGVASIGHAALTSTPTAWTNFGSPAGYVQDYTYGGVPTTDNEGAADPSTGGAAPNPCTLDLGSAGNPGPQSTEFYGYYDGG